MADATASTDNPRKRRGRSPSYPAISLDAAVQRAKELWDEEKQYPAPAETAVKHWGYRSLNGPAGLALAALKKFGLVEYEGSGSDRLVQLTDLAVEIIANPDQQAKAAAIQTAALQPAIHKELWDKYGSSLPSNDNLKWELTRQRNFTNTGATEFIREYRRTIAVAQLAGTDSVATQTPESETQDDSHDEEERVTSPPARRQPRPHRMSESNANVLTIPLPGRTPVIIEGDFPISDQQWDQLMAVLNAMKPGLVSVAEEHASDLEDA